MLETCQRNMFRW